MVDLLAEAGLSDLTLAEVDEALSNVRITLRMRLNDHQREVVEDYRDHLLDRRLVLCAASKSR